MTATTFAPSVISGQANPPTVHRVREHTVEIVSDSGEGAQKCGQVFGAVSAKMGNGVWTVEIIPAEIQPPARVPEGASGFRIRIGDGPSPTGATRPSSSSRSTSRCCWRGIAWARSLDDAIAADREQVGGARRPRHSRRMGRGNERALDEAATGLILVPMEERCLTLVDDPKKGKNMFALGMLACIYGRDMERVA